MYFLGYLSLVSFFIFHLYVVSHVGLFLKERLLFLRCLLCKYYKNTNEESHGKFGMLLENHDLLPILHNEVQTSQSELLEYRKVKNTLRL